MNKVLQTSLNNYKEIDDDHIVNAYCLTSYNKKWTKKKTKKKKKNYLRPVYNSNNATPIQWVSTQKHGAAC